MFVQFDGILPNPHATRPGVVEINPSWDILMTMRSVCVRMESVAYIVRPARFTHPRSFLTISSSIKAMCTAVPSKTDKT